METNELHRGRLIDHVQLVVRDLAASHAFYAAVFQALEVPMGGANEEYFWADELFVSTASSVAAQGQLTGRVHLAFQAQNRDMVHAFYEARWHTAGKTMARPASASITPATTLHSCWTRMATTSRHCSVATRSAVRRP